MNQLYLYLVILIFILFLMYVYKKKCDEDYYINLIQFTQQQYQYNFQYQLQNNLNQKQSIQEQKYYYNNYNKNNNKDCYKTPKRKKSFHIYKDFSGLNNVSPSSSINFNYTNNHFINEKVVLNNNIRSNENENNFDNKFMNGNFGNQKRYINKKIFKLEDFLTNSKIKNSGNNKINNDLL